MQMPGPLDSAKAAHRETRTPVALDQLMLAGLRAPGRSRGPGLPAPRFATWWVPAITTPVVLLLWFFLHSPVTPLSPVTPFLAPAPVTAGDPVAAGPCALPQQWSVASVLPEPMANHVTLWSICRIGY